MEKKVTQNKESMLPLNDTPGKRVKECRKNKRISQRELAERIENLPENNGISRNEKHISAIENDKRPLSEEYARLIAMVLNVDHGYLLCKTNYKNFHDQIHAMHIHAGHIRNSDSIRQTALTDALSAVGYTIEYVFVDNWEELKKKHPEIIEEILNKGGIISAENFLDRLSPDSSTEVRYSYMVRCPNGKKFYCGSDSIDTLNDKITDFLVMEMKQLERQYCIDCLYNRVHPIDPKSKLLGMDYQASKSDLYDPKSISPAHESEDFPDARGLENV